MSCFILKKVTLMLWVPYPGIGGTPKPVALHEFESVGLDMTEVFDLLRRETLTVGGRRYEVTAIDEEQASVIARGYIAEGSRAYFDKLASAGWSVSEEALAHHGLPSDEPFEVAQPRWEGPSQAELDDAVEKLSAFRDLATRMAATK